MAFLAHSHPRRASRRGQDGLDELLREFFTRPESEIIRPSADIAESAAEVIVTLAVPGVDPKKIQISVDNGVLDVHGETGMETGEKKTYYRQEIRYGAFRRTIPLPTAVDIERASAHLENGLLTITMPKTKATKSHQIKLAA